MNTSKKTSSASHRSISDDIGMAFQVHPLNPDIYSRDRIYAMLDQIVDPMSPKRYIDEAHCRALADFFCNYEYRYARSMKKMYFSLSISPEGSTYASALHNTHWKKLVADGYCIFMLDHRHQRRSVEMLRDDDTVGWSANPLRVYYTFQLLWQD